MTQQDRPDTMKATNTSLTPPGQDQQQRSRDYPEQPHGREQVRTGSPDHISPPGYANGFDQTENTPDAGNAKNVANDLDEGSNPAAIPSNMPGRNNDPELNAPPPVGPGQMHPGHAPITGVGEQGRRDLPTPDRYPGQQQQLVEESPEQPQVQAEPKPPYPNAKIEKPGLEKDLSLKPQYMAPRYKAAGKLQGKVALITGGDSGIGRAVAVLYAREGADVAIVCTPVEQVDAEETRRAVEAEGRRFIMILGDLTDPQFCRECVERTVRELGQLDILVSNAAWQNRKQSIEEVSEEEWRRTFSTNIDAYFHLTKAAVPRLKPGSAIIATTSEVSLIGSSSLLDYSATKGAINAFTKSLAQQLIKKGIRVNAVAPGPVWTPLNPADRGMSPEQPAKFGQDQPMKRAAQPEEIAPAYVFLASDPDSSYITGIVLEEMGGETTAG